MKLVKLETPELTVIEESKAAKIKATFEPMVKMLSEFEEQYDSIIKESKKEITLELCQKAKRCRLDVGKVRIETGKLKDKQKEYIKLEDKAIMGVHNLLVWAVKEKEDTLKGVEDYFEIQEKKRLEELQAQRVEMLSPYVEDAHERDLSSMELDVWNAYFGTKQKEYTDRIEAEKQAEKDRIKKEKARITEEKRIREENKRLQKEAELKAKVETELHLIREKRKPELIPYAVFIRDYHKLINLGEKEYQKEFSDIKKGAELQWEYDRKEAQKEIKKQEKEHKEYEAKLKKEREQREKEAEESAILQAKLNAENQEKERRLKALKEAEQKEKQRLLGEELAKKKAEKAARLAPDKVKLLQLANSIMLTEIPELKSAEAIAIKNNVVELLAKIDSYIKEKTADL